ncbi:MAG: DEAD/DEAH box helicase [Methylotenera sp.]
MNEEIISTDIHTCNFNDLGLNESLIKAIQDAGYTKPTPIQAKAIPLVLNGEDLLAGAQTGTGKTAGFTLPILHLLNQNSIAEKLKGRPRCLILTPTRELAAQVGESVKTYAKYLNIKSMVVFGGVSINPQINRLERMLDILVATPGRLLDLVNQKKVDLSGVEILVLDEADRMLDMGFIHDIKKILAKLPKTRQNLLFSATFSDEIKNLADGLLNSPSFIEVAKRNTASEMVTQSAHTIPQAHKRDFVVHLMKENNWQQVLIFTRTKHGANRLTEKLVKNDISALAIHGNKSQGARTRALAEFKAGTVRALVATDIAARGLDIDQLPQVINFELPNIAEDYVHRIGRTGRAGAAGAAISLVDAEELKYLKEIEKLINRKIPIVNIEGFEAPEVIEPEPPRLFRGQQPNSSQEQKKKQGKNKHRTQKQDNGKAVLARQQRAFGDQPRPSKKTNGHHQPYAKEDSQSAEHLSEAARHQAMPQTPIYAADLNIGRRHDARRNPKTKHNAGTTKGKNNSVARFSGNANKGR